MYLENTSFCFLFSPGSIQRKIEEYSSTFTIHGLSRIFEAKSQIESLFWFIMLALAIAAAFVMGQTLILKFWDKDVYTSTENHVTSNNTFPSVIFCLSPILEREKYCGSKANDVFPGKIPLTVLSCNEGEWWNRIIRIDQSIAQLKTVGATEIKTLPFGTFSISCPRKSSSCVQDYLQDKYFMPLNNSISCVTWNQNGDFSNLKNKIDLHLSKYPDGNFFVYIHDHRESPVSTERYFPLDSKSNTQIFIRKSVRKKIKRNPPNDCEDAYTNNKKNIFPGRYTVEACMDTYTCIQSLIKCGDILDFCRLHMPIHLIKKHWKANQSIAEVHRCFYEGFRSGSFNQVKGDECLTPCEKEFYPVSFVTTPGDMDITLLFEERNVYEHTEEKFVYMWQDVVAGVGGLIGLFCGLSILSIIEVLVYLWLQFISLFYRNPNTPTKTNKMELENTAASSINYGMT